MKEVMWIIKQIVKEVKGNKRPLVTTQTNVPLQTTNNERKIHPSMLLFARAKGSTMFKSMNRCINALKLLDIQFVNIFTVI